MQFRLKHRCGKDYPQEFPRCHTVNLLSWNFREWISRKNFRLPAFQNAHSLRTQPSPVGRLRLKSYRPTRDGCIRRLEWPLHNMAVGTFGTVALAGSHLNFLKPFRETERQRSSKPTMFRWTRFASQFHIETSTVSQRAHVWKCSDEVKTNYRGCTNLWGELYTKRFHPLCSFWVRILTDVFFLLLNLF